MQVVILCGGKGTRAYPYTEYMPKPMLPVAGQPILLHVMRIFASQGHREFLLSVGYNKEVIIDYFDRKLLDWDVRFIDTGEDTDTGGRIGNLQDELSGRFMATYADGLMDIPLDKLLAFHDQHGGPATVTSVPLRSQYGVFEAAESGQVLAFQEKPVLREHWINAGFFVFDKDVFNCWHGTNLEKHVLPGLIDRKLLHTYRHNGFFRSMDTYKDQQELEVLYRDGSIPCDTRVRPQVGDRRSAPAKGRYVASSPSLRPTSQKTDLRETAK
jgi:glucose-1-phosphate cytidylyltransferase